MSTKNVRLTIIVNDNIDSKLIYKEIRNIQRLERISGNKIMTMELDELYRKLKEDALDAKTLYGKSFGSYIENILNQEIVGFNSRNVAAFRGFLFSKANFDGEKILKGEESNSCFKRNLPVYIHSASMKLSCDNQKNYSILISLFNRQKMKELNCKQINFGIANIKWNSQRAILDRIISGEYKQGTGQIIYNEEKSKWELLLSYSFIPEKKEGELDENLILGVDLGIVNVAALAIYDKTKDEFPFIKYKQSLIDGREIIHYRQQIQARKRELQSASKIVSDCKCGKGYKKRMAKFLEIRDKEARFRDTYNHKLSRYIVDYAFRHHCGIIKFEDLSGFPKYHKETFLKQWSYYDLQMKVKYKAEELGIKVKFINPKYTSQTCSRCGHLEEGQRITRDKFVCKCCGHESNADINGAENIAKSENYSKKSLENELDEA